MSSARERPSGSVYIHPKRTDTPLPPHTPAAGSNTTSYKIIGLFPAQRDPSEEGDVLFPKTEMKHITVFIVELLSNNG